MAKRIAVTQLDASTLDILNVIRANASAEYQSLVPEVTQATDIPKVGEILYGYPALANQFINALVNRIALVRVKSATFNNPYGELKKGYLQFGETIEEVFVELAKAREFSAEKAEAREFKRTLPDVKSAFHVMNYRVQYPITIQDRDLQMAFTSMEGVQDLIAKIVNAVYVAAEYDEFLLFKYMLIKGYNKQIIKDIAAGSSPTTTQLAKIFRGTSNKMQFIRTDYNFEGVHTATPREDQYIFMSADFNAEFDVDVLASAFNMNKADFMGHLKLIDDWTTFDNERFAQIIEGSDTLEPVTQSELNLMSIVKAIIVDKEWFQFYDNENRMTEKYVASGLYWNYFYHVWKTVSWSPFSNAVAIVDGSELGAPNTLNVRVFSKDANSVTFETAVDSNYKIPARVNYVGTESTTALRIGVQPYGAIIFDSYAIDATEDDNTTKFKLRAEGYGATYESADLGLFDLQGGVVTTFTLTKQS